MRSTALRTASPRQTRVNSFTCCTVPCWTSFGRVTKACTRTDQPKRQQPDWWNDVCMDMLFARNSAWRERRRNPTPDAAAAFRRARNKFHRVVQVKSSQVKSSQVKSSQVKSSQVKSSQAIRRPLGGAGKRKKERAQLYNYTESDTVSNCG